MEERTAEQVVKGVWPRAIEHWVPWNEEEPFCVAQIYTEDSVSAKLLGEGDTMDEAWEDAAKRIESGVK